MIQIIGYIATVIVLISFTFKDVTKLRTINSIGCFLFVIYGSLNHDIPIIVTNSLILNINIYQLFKTYNTNLKNKRYKL